MLTIKENLKETMKGGNPDRFVNQYEFLDILLEAPFMAGVFAEPGKEMKDGWGITWRWQEGQIGQFPVHDEEHIVLKDITQWEKYVKAPSVEFPEEAWQAAIDHAKAVDRKQKYVTAFIAPGIFEMTHHLMRMENALISFYEEPEAMHELIDYLTEYELNVAKEYIKYIQPDALFHHDDWGGQTSTFLSPQMFTDFLLEPYIKIYKFWKANGVEIIVHHNDAYSATLVPYMIEMGIDIWQGAMTTNNTPELIKKYGKEITFMGDIDSGPVDFPEWTPEIAAEHVERACTRCGKTCFIPCLTQGLGMSSFPGVYESVSNAIDNMSKKMFK
ncbi:MAG: uroporphyrinogen decarboxylase [Spirochaetes bacterium]|nr:uroporphyrinogen decarboxylase [Spirochaetota bacterium]